MKLVLKQYLSSMKERDELDVVLPDILSEAGFTVISRPGRGTTQYGVDVAATGSHPETGKKALYLLSIKSGDLTRAEWATGKQALRPSLEEMIEVYIPKHLPARYKNLPIIVALCFGGDVHEDVRLRVDGFIDKNTDPGRLEFEEWNGDHIANLIATGILREKIFPKNMQSTFRKAVAFVDEPSICIAHFEALLRQLVQSPPKNLTSRLRVARQIYLATWTIFIWCRDAENLEAAYCGSTAAALRMWDLCHAHFGKSGQARVLTKTMHKMLVLNQIISSAYIDKHVKPFGDTEDGLGVSVRPNSSVDVNLKLFEVLGRVALSGLWLIHLKAVLSHASVSSHEVPLETDLQKSLNLICDLVENNPVYFTPLRDDHAIEITLACLFLLHCNAHDFIAKWIEQITLSTIFAHRSNGQYPCVLREYGDLAAHPKATDGYQQEATIGSVLYPTLAIWLAICNDTECFRVLADFHATEMTHSTWQLWIPDTATEEHLYVDSSLHGSCVSHLATSEGPEKFLEQVHREIVACSEFGELSAIKSGQWPIVLMACLTHRLPIPPHFLTMRLLPESDTSAS